MEVRFSPHAYRRMLERGIATKTVLAAIRFGEPVEAYPGAQPLPCKLLLYETAEGPLHVVVAEDAVERAIIVVTVCRPDPGHWHEDFRRRR